MPYTSISCCAGTRLSDFATASQAAFHHPEVKFIGINVAGRDAYKQGALPIVADAREALRALAKACAEAGIEPDAAYVEEIAAAHASLNAAAERGEFDPSKSAKINLRTGEVAGH